MFNEFGKARTLADGFMWSVACCKAGIPCLLVAPPSGGKTTVIFGTEHYLKDIGEPTLKVSRLGLRGLTVLTKFLEANSIASLLNEDYATIGSSDYMVEKLGELIGALSYSGTYSDYGLHINLTVTRLGFISGVQPLWIKTLMTHVVFSTHIREKFLRYYFLPYCASADVDDKEAIEILLKNLKEGKYEANFQIPSQFIEALSFQVGSTRAKIYAPRLAREIAKFFKPQDIPRALKFFATRIGFERSFVQREIGERGYNVETQWSPYHALYWTLRQGKITKEQYMERLGVTSLRSVERCVQKAIGLGWITSIWNSGKKVFIPNYNILKGDFSR